MHRPLSAVLTGTVASVVSTVALSAFAKAEGKGAAQPTNATSHWLLGEEAGSYRGVDVAHTGLGLVTHYASALFCAAI